MSIPFANLVLTCTNGLCYHYCMNDYPVKNNFVRLLKNKEALAGRNITYLEITQETGIAASTLSSYAKNKVRLYDAKTVARLCEFFNCELSEFLVLAPT